MCLLSTYASFCRLRPHYGTRRIHWYNQKMEDIFLSLSLVEVVNICMLTAFMDDFLFLHHFAEWEMLDHFHCIHVP